MEEKFTLSSNYNKLVNWNGNFSNHNIEIRSILDISIEKMIPIELSELYFNDLKNVTNSWFWITLEENDIKNHLYKSDLIYVIKNSWDIIWFSSIKLFNQYVYRYWTVIQRDYQWKWIYKLLNNYMWLENWFLRTQNLNIINSLKNTWYNVLLWKEAYLYITESIKKEDFHKIFVDLWDENDFLNDWVFKWVYWWKMWYDWNVSFIDDNYYEWFDYVNWDSLLVVYNK